jgi:hypothetical protein
LAQQNQAEPNKTKQNTLVLFGFIRPNRGLQRVTANPNKKTFPSLDPWRRTPKHLPLLDYARMLLREGTHIAKILNI